jgi:hypothetical protein
MRFNWRFCVVYLIVGDVGGGFKLQRSFQCCFSSSRRLFASSILLELALFPHDFSIIFLSFSQLSFAYQKSFPLTFFPSALQTSTTRINTCIPINRLTKTFHQLISIISTAHCHKHNKCRRKCELSLHVLYNFVLIFLFTQSNVSPARG